MPVASAIPRTESRRTAIVEADTLESAISIGLTKLKITRASAQIEILVEPQYGRILRTVKRRAKVRITAL